MGTKRTYAIIDHGDVLECSECGSRASVVIVDHTHMRAAPRCLVHARAGRRFVKRAHKAKANAKHDGVTP